MKTAFHFDCRRLPDGEAAIIAVLSAVRSTNRDSRSKVFIGTLLFMEAASQRFQENGVTVERIDKERFISTIKEWVYPQPFCWHALRSTALDAAMHAKVFSVCFETLDVTTASAVHLALESKFQDAYVGALEVDESIASHLGVYMLSVVGRVDRDRAMSYWDGFSEDSKMEYQLEWYRRAGFSHVAYESLEGRYTIFDRDHGSEQTYRNALSRRWMRELLDSLVDHAIVQLAEGAPEIPEKIWSALRLFRNLTVQEEASYVALACRRIFESVADSLFPPTDSQVDGRKLGTDKFKNRLLMYLELQRAGSSEKNMIMATMNVTADELDKLYISTNKGVHSDFNRMQARRCLLRTFLLLDDLMSIRNDPLPTRVRHDYSIFNDLFGEDEKAD